MHDCPDNRDDENIVSGFSVLNEPDPMDLSWQNPFMSLPVLEEANALSHPPAAAQSDTKHSLTTGYPNTNTRVNGGQSQGSAPAHGHEARDLDQEMSDPTKDSTGFLDSSHLADLCKQSKDRQTRRHADSICRLEEKRKLALDRITHEEPNAAAATAGHIELQRRQIKRLRRLLNKRLQYLADEQKRADKKRADKKRADKQRADKRRAKKLARKRRRRPKSDMAKLTAGLSKMKVAGD